MGTRCSYGFDDSYKSPEYASLSFDILHKGQCTLLVTYLQLCIVSFCCIARVCCCIVAKIADKHTTYSMSGQKAYAYTAKYQELDDKLMLALYMSSAAYISKCQQRLLSWQIYQSKHKKGSIESRHAGKLQVTRASQQLHAMQLVCSIGVSKLFLCAASLNSKQFSSSRWCQAIPRSFSA